MRPPILETERLILRPLKLSDAEAYFRYFNEWEIVRYLGKGVPWPYTPDYASQFIEMMLSEKQNDILFWAITCKGRAGLSDELIGGIEVYLNAEDTHRGFWLGLPFHNNGFMTEAASAVTDYWFYTLGKKVMRLRNAIGNTSSKRIKEKNGAEFIGLVKKNYMDPLFTEAEAWEITKERWKDISEINSER